MGLTLGAAFLPAWVCRMRMRMRIALSGTLGTERHNFLRAWMTTTTTTTRHVDDDDDVVVVVLLNSAAAAVPSSSSSVAAALLPHLPKRTALGHLCPKTPWARLGPSPEKEEARTQARRTPTPWFRLTRWARLRPPAECESWAVVVFGGGRAEGAIWRGAPMSGRWEKLEPCFEQQRTQSSKAIT